MDVYELLSEIIEALQSGAIKGTDDVVVYFPPELEEEMKCAVYSIEPVPTLQNTCCIVCD